MSKNKNILPRFENEEQEAEFWDKHSPLDFVSQPKLENVKATSAKDRPIAIRLDSETRRKLDELANRRGLGPSTLARTIIVDAIENMGHPPQINSVWNLLASSLRQADKEKLERFQKEVAIGDPENPALLVFSGARKNWEETASLVMARLLAAAGFEIVRPENRNYETLKEMIKPETSKSQ